MRMVSIPVLTAGLFWLAASSWAQNPCDLTNDGAVTAADVNAAVNMALGLSPCVAKVQGSGVCDAVTVQRVINAALGGTCVNGAATRFHSVTVTWIASISMNVVGYNVYRAPTLVGPFTRLNLALVGGTTYTDSSVQGGQTYYYAATAVDASGNESTISNPPAQGVIPVGN